MDEDEGEDDPVKKPLLNGRILENGIFVHYTENKEKGTHDPHFLL